MAKLACGFAAASLHDMLPSGEDIALASCVVHGQIWKPVIGSHSFQKLRALLRDSPDASHSHKPVLKSLTLAALNRDTPGMMAQV